MLRALNRQGARTVAPADDGNDWVSVTMGVPKITGLKTTFGRPTAPTWSWQTPAHAANLGRCGIAKLANPPLFPAVEIMTAHTVAIMFRGGTTPLRAGQKVERTIFGCFLVCLKVEMGSSCSNESLAWEVIRNLCRSYHGGLG